MKLNQEHVWDYLGRIWSFYKDKRQHEVIWQTIVYVVYGFYFRLQDILNGRSIKTAPVGMRNTFLNSEAILAGTICGRIINGFSTREIEGQEDDELLPSVLSIDDFWSDTPVSQGSMRVGLSTVEDSGSFQFLPETFWQVGKAGEISYTSFVGLEEDSFISGVELGEGRKVLRNGHWFLLGEGYSRVFVDESGVFSRVDNFSVGVVYNDLICDDNWVMVSHAGGISTFSFDGGVLQAEYAFSGPVSFLEPHSSGGYLFFVKGGNELCRVKIGSFRSVIAATEQTIRVFDEEIIGIFIRDNILYVLRDVVGANTTKYNVFDPLSVVLLGDGSYFSPPADFHTAKPEKLFLRQDFNFLVIFWADGTNGSRIVVYFFDSNGDEKRIGPFGVLSGFGDEGISFNLFSGENRIASVFDNEGDRYFNFFNLKQDRIEEVGVSPLLEEDIGVFDDFIMFHDKFLLLYDFSGSFKIYEMDRERLDGGQVIDFSVLGAIDYSNFVELNSALLDAVVLDETSEEEGSEQEFPKNIISNWSWNLIKEGEDFIFTLTGFGYDCKDFDENFLKLYPSVGDRDRLIASDVLFGSGAFSLGDNGDIVRIFTDGVKPYYDDDPDQHLNFFITMKENVFSKKGELIQNKVKVTLERERIASAIFDVIIGESGLNGVGVKFYNSRTKYKLSFNEKIPLPVRLPLFSTLDFSSEQTNDFLCSELFDGKIAIKKENGSFVFPYYEEDTYIISNDPYLNGVFKLVFNTDQVCVFENTFEERNSVPVFSFNEVSIGVFELKKDIDDNVYFVTLESAEKFLGSYFKVGEVNVYLLSLENQNIFTKEKFYKAYEFDDLAGEFVEHSLAVDGDYTLYFNNGWNRVVDFSYSKMYNYGDGVYSEVFCVGRAGIISRSLDKEATIFNLEDRVIEEIEENV